MVSPPHECALVNESPSRRRRRCEAKGHGERARAWDLSARARSRDATGRSSAAVVDAVVFTSTARAIEGAGASTARAWTTTVSEEIPRLYTARARGNIARASRVDHARARAPGENAGGMSRA